MRGNNAYKKKERVSKPRHSGIAPSMYMCVLPSTAHCTSVDDVHISERLAPCNVQCAMCNWRSQMDFQPFRRLAGIDLLARQTNIDKRWSRCVGRERGDSDRRGVQLSRCGGSKHHPSMGNSPSSRVLKKTIRSLTLCSVRYTGITANAPNQENKNQIVGGGMKSDDEGTHGV
jgi:hypothetical protein